MARIQIHAILLTLSAHRSLNGTAVDLDEANETRRKLQKVAPIALKAFARLQATRASPPQPAARAGKRRQKLHFCNRQAEVVTLPGRFADGFPLCRSLEAKDARRQGAEASDPWPGSRRWGARPGNREMAPQRLEKIRFCAGKWYGPGSLEPPRSGTRARRAFFVVARSVLPRAGRATCSRVRERDSCDGGFGGHY